MLFLGDYIYEKSWGRDLVRHHDGGRADLARRLSQPLRALQIRPRPAGRARRASLDRDLGRPRGDRRLHRRHRTAGSRSRALPRPARRGLPGLLGAHAAAQRDAARAARRCGSTTAIASAISPSCSRIDDRQYRAHHACRATLTRGKPLENCAERLDPTRTMLGAEQEAWFADGMAKRLGALEPDRAADADGRARPRPGRAARLLGRRLGRLSRGATAPARCGRGLAGADTLVLGGDVHSFWAADLKHDFAEPKSPHRGHRVRRRLDHLAGPDRRARAGAGSPSNPHIRYGRGGVNGYGVVALERQAGAGLVPHGQRRARSASRGIATATRFAVEAGQPGVAAGLARRLFR